MQDYCTLEKITKNRFATTLIGAAVLAFSLAASAAQDEPHGPRRVPVNALSGVHHESVHRLS
jgi:hypothetical protein